MTIFVEGERVVLVPPPGAAAVLSVAQTRWLGNVLEQAMGRTGKRLGT